MEEIKAIIFDLGGVIIDLDQESEIRYFVEQGIPDYENIFSQKNMTNFFKEQEVGDISEPEFYEGFRKLTNVRLSDEKIEEGWNKILTDFLSERIMYLEELSKRYPIYLFSNTNTIHTREFEKRCLGQFGRPLSSYFRELFYSQELGLRKPEREAFIKVIELAGLDVKTTVFIDDNRDNIEGTISVGLQTMHLTSPTTILDLKF
ncbi:MAG TPA: HAD family phosphatase [Lactovum miscens]|uniref:HAD family hydrolase n=1 Tax=Lactovum miscens TaxID=190387 RepID=UPI002ED80591